MTDSNETNNGFYFLSLSLENVRCFADKQTLDLSDGNNRPAQWTVILGDNGVGKTTLLEVLSKGFYIHDLKKICRISKDSSSVMFLVIFKTSLNNKPEPFLKRQYESKFHSNNITVKSVRHIDGDINFYSDDEFSNQKLKLFFYTASRRLKKDNNSSKELENQTKDNDELIDAEKWLLDIDYIASKPSDIQNKYKELLNTIKETLKDLLPYVTDIRITEPSEESPHPRVQFQMPEGWLLLSQLSLGYQTMTAWMVDLAARLFKEYPNSKNPIAEPAIVLIDEIDLHLHPKWQRTIMSYLSERFINTQFIVTAHSPLIVQAAENANIVVLKREGNSVKIKQEHQAIQGWRIDQLLTSDLFDLSSARSPYYEDLLKQRDDILSQSNLTDEDEEKLKELKNKIGNLPTAETPEDIQAMDIIRRAAQLLK
ncbi:hypothetical protein DOJK_01938 [Patescibacteria group bacterium]|nr:hypothetical protein DOJK_01938 [Patescibacteria group bacterium]